MNAAVERIMEARKYDGVYAGAMPTTKRTSRDAASPMARTRRDSTRPKLFPALSSVSR